MPDGLRSSGGDEYLASLPKACDVHRSWAVAGPVPAANSTTRNPIRNFTTTPPMSAKWRRLIRAGAFSIHHAIQRQQFRRVERQYMRDPDQRIESEPTPCDLCCESGLRDPPSASQPRPRTVPQLVFDVTQYQPVALPGREVVRRVHIDRPGKPSLFSPHLLGPPSGVRLCRLDRDHLSAFLTQRIESAPPPARVNRNLDRPT